MICGILVSFVYFVLHTMYHVPRILYTMYYEPYSVSTNVHVVFCAPTESVRPAPQPWSEYSSLRSMAGYRTRFLAVVFIFKGSALLLSTQMEDGFQGFT